jgi:hypothetical protein
VRVREVDVSANDVLELAGAAVGQDEYQVEWVFKDIDMKPGHHALPASQASARGAGARI